MLKSVVIMLLSTIVLLLSFSLHAEKYPIYPMSDLEVSLLPPFCQSWHKADEAATDAWVAKLDIPNIHHFCKGLWHVNHTTMSFDDKSKRGDAKNGIKEFNYILIRHQHFPLKPFLLVNMAKLYIILSRYNEAISNYKAAIKENPKFSRAYADLIDLYIKLKDKGSARQILTAGLNHIPNSKLLLRRKKKLGK